MVKICPNCGTQATDDHSMFCNKCGTKLTEKIPENETNFCPNCGASIPRKESLFCNKCGSPLPTPKQVKTQPTSIQPVPRPEPRRRPVNEGVACPACGAINEEGRFYCNSCGAYLKESPAPRMPSPKNIEYSEKSRHQTIRIEKSPFLAVLVSFFIPGAGQCYTNQWGKGIALFVFAVISAILCLIIIGFFPLIIIWAYSMYDAYHAAVKINQGGENIDDDYRSRPTVSRFGNNLQTNHGNKSRSKLGLVVIGVGILFVVLLLAAAFGSHSAGSSGGLSDSSTSDPLITQNLNSIALTINDLPTGWQTYGTPTITTNSYHSGFVKVEGFSSYVVYQDIERNDTIENAMELYNSKKAAITQYRVDTVNVGGEGFGYVSTDSANVVFRKSNIVVSTQYGEGGFGAGNSDLSTDDANTYAQIIAGRIQS